MFFYNQSIFQKYILKSMLQKRQKAGRFHE